MDRGQDADTLDNVRHALPGTAVRGLVQAGVIILFLVRVTVQPNGILFQEINDTRVHPAAPSPKQPFLRGGLEGDDVKAAHEGRVQVGKLVLVTFVDRRNDAASFRKTAACQRAVQSQVHDGLKNLRAGTVEFIQEQDDGLAVQREPVRRHEFRLSGFGVFGRDTDEVARVCHLTEEKRNDRHSFSGVVFSKNLGLANAVTTHQHQVVAGRDKLQDLEQFSCVDFDVGHTIFHIHRSGETRK